MTNQERRQIITEAKAKGYTGSYVDLFRQAAQNPEMLVAETPEQKQAGLRPLHEAGRTDASMAFKDVPPNTPFNTVGMKAPIDIKKYDEQGHLVKSYEDVPPGLTNIDSGPRRGTVLETPSRMQEGGMKGDYNYERAKELGYGPDETGHWPSVDDETGMWLKSTKHPTAVKELLHGYLGEDHYKTDELIKNPQGPFGENQLQYVPRKKAQEGTFLDIDPRLLNRIEVPDTPQTSVKPNIMGDRENEGARKRFEADQKRREAIEKGINPNLAFMMPQGLGTDSEAKAAYQYDNPATSNIGQIASGIGFLPIDRGLDIALTAAGSAVRAGADKFNAKTIRALQDKSTPILKEKVAGREVEAYKKFKSEIDWGKWNPDTPNHPVLMDEYKQIEFNTKRNGTWMKNADGSAYKGRPEQFVQEQSSHFKKAFPEGANRLFHGTTDATKKITSDLGDRMIFTADENLARNYTNVGESKKWDIPLSTPQKVYTKTDFHDAAAMSLLQPRSSNKYAVVTGQESWEYVPFMGKSKKELQKSIGFLEGDLAKRQQRLAAATDPNNKMLLQKSIDESTDRIRKYKRFLASYDDIVHTTPSGTPNFAEILKNSKNASTPWGFPAMMTDDIGEHMIKEGVDHTIFYGLHDGGPSLFVNIHNNRPGNYLKSRIGNVGFFDMKSDDIFKAMVPLGSAGAAMKASSSGKRDTYKKGGYIKKSKKIKRRKAQKGQAVDYLLGALGQQGDMSAAEIGAQQAQDAAAITSGAQSELAKEEQRVKDVRANVIPTAENLAQLNKDIKTGGHIFSDYYDHNRHFNKMKEAKTPEEYEALEAEAKEKYPELIEAIPRNNLLVMRPDKYDADDELYCTPYGCYTYKKAGARDVPEYSGNPGFVAGAKSGKNPFQKISADEAVPGDVGIMYEYEVNDYRDESAGMSLRPHHTTILSEKTDDPQTIRNFSAINGARLNFREEELTARDKKDAEGNVHKGRWDFYRYIGQTPQAQRAVTDARHNQSQADLAAQALQQQAELAAQMPEREADNVSLIDRRQVEQIETDDPTADIVTTPKKKKKKKKRSAREVVENVTNRIAGEVHETQDRKQSIREIRKRHKEKIQAIKSGQ